jgi:hypothetical protein
MINYSLIKKIKTNYKFYQNIQKLEIKNISFFFRKLMLKKHLNEFEINLLKSLFYKEIEIEMIEAILDKYEVLEQNEITNEIMDEEKKLFDQLNELRTVKFVDIDDEKLDNANFILINPHYKEDTKKYRENVNYRNNVDISEGFYKLIKIYHLFSVFDDSNPMYLKRNNYAKQLIASDYELSLYLRLQRGLGIKSAIDDIVDHNLEYMPFAPHTKKKL